ncbi:hypothetical protein CYY_001181 [Polysphondylium violaceum]|uniref:Assembly chaperone of rpl4 n=1 Tax=Polysphondylium violaceum TaxID=133409 RepID=A0A8J4Q2D7_9MYCE|nr:hypothetical protein CYY_001181 [Polysphondylium violaceum]
MTGGKKSAASKVKAQKTKVKTADQWMEEGEEFAARFHFDKALNCFQNALKLEPTDTVLMDTIGEILLEMGDLEQAKSYFFKSIQTNPEESASAYMNLGQLVGGDDAVRCYNKGIEIMERELHRLVSNGAASTSVPKPLSTKDAGLTDEQELEEDYEDEEEQDPVADIKQQICSACCSLAELYLTDQCFDDNAETECEKNLLKAIECSPYSPEPYSLMASMKISQVKNQEATEYLTKSYGLWENADVDERPEFDYRYSIALLFIELAQNRVAVDILEQLVNEQDNIAEVWYTLGVVYNNLKEPLSAQECLSTAKDLLKISKEKDPELEDQISTLLTNVNEQVSLLPPASSDEEEDDQVVNDDDDDEEDEEMDD